MFLIVNLKFLGKWYFFFIVFVSFRWRSCIVNILVGDFIFKLVFFVFLISYGFVFLKRIWVIFFYDYKVGYFKYSLKLYWFRKVLVMVFCLGYMIVLVISSLIVWYYLVENLV